MAGTMIDRATILGTDEDDILLGTPDDDIIAGGGEDRNLIVLGDVTGADTGDDTILDFDIDNGCPPERSYDQLSFTFNGSLVSLSTTQDMIDFVDRIEHDGDRDTDALYDGTDLIFSFGQDRGSVRLVNVIGRDELTLDRLQDHSIDQLDQPRPDIVSVAQTTNPIVPTVWILRQEGDGKATFSAPVRTFDITASFPESFNDIRVIDLNADGRLDLIGSTYTRGGIFNLVAFQDEDGGFSEAEFLPPPDAGILGGALALGDIDGNGRLDIVDAGPPRLESELLVLRLQNEDGSFRIISQNFPGIRGARLGDMDGDGRLDVVVRDEDGLSLLLQGDDISDFDRLPVSVEGDLLTWELGDLNDDGRLDIVLSTESRISLLIQEETGLVRRDITAAEDTYELTLGDLEGDGRLDIIARTDSGITILDQQEDGQFRRTDINLPASDIALGDVDDDGLLDIGVAPSAEDSDPILLLQASDGGFRAQQVAGAPGTEVGIVLADLDETPTPGGFPDLGPLVPEPADLSWLM